MAEARLAPIPLAPQGRANAIAAGAIGNALEWYDFGVYVYLAVFMSQVFFASPSAGLMLTFGTFAVGYLMQPIGSIVLGHVGDRVGRRVALTIGVLGMAVATFAIGLLPTFAAVGIAAPLLLTALRMVQGFAAGGEWGGAAAYMIEHAPPRGRGFATSWQQFTVLMGTLLGVGLSALLTSVLTEADMLSFGWRIPFLLGIVLGAVGVYMRWRTPETPLFRQLKREGVVEEAPLLRLWRHRGAMVRIIGICIQWDVTFTFYLNYTPTYLTKVLGFPAAFGLIVATITTAVVAALVPLTGMLSDRIGRRPVLALAGVLSITLTLPVFLLLQDAGHHLAALLLVVIALPIALLSGAAPSTLAELVPTGVRYSGLSIPSAVSVAVFGGLTPLIATALVTLTGHPLSVAFYVMAAAVIGLVTVVFTRETAMRPLI